MSWVRCCYIAQGDLKLAILQSPDLHELHTGCHPIVQTPGSIFKGINTGLHYVQPRGARAPKESIQPLAASPQGKLLNLIASHFPHLLKIKRDATWRLVADSGMNACVHTRGAVAGGCKPLCRGIVILS